MPSSLYLITPSTPSARDIATTEMALQVGIACLQFRAKGLSAPEKLTLGKKLRALCAQYQTPFIVNDDVDLCVALDADGVHLGQKDGNVRAARQQLGHKFVGVTCHNQVALAIKALEEGASYVAMGRFFPSITKPEASPCTLEELSAARERLNCPIVAIGGINPDNSHLVLSAGANFVAVIDSVYGHEHPDSEVRRFNALTPSNISPLLG